MGTVVAQEYQRSYRSDSGTYTISGKSIRIDFSRWPSREGYFDDTIVNLTTVGSSPWSLIFHRQGN